MERCRRCAQRHRAIESAMPKSLTAGDILHLVAAFTRAECVRLSHLISRPQGADETVYGSLPLPRSRSVTGGPGRAPRDACGFCSEFRPHFARSAESNWSSVVRSGEWPSTSLAHPLIKSKPHTPPRSPILVIPRDRRGSHEPESPIQRDGPGVLATDHQPHRRRAGSADFPNSGS